MDIIADQLAEQFRFWTTDLDGITDENRVKAAENSPDSARKILWDSYQRTLEVGVEKQHPVAWLLRELALGEMPLNELQKHSEVKQAMRPNVPEQWLLKNGEKLGSDYHAYLNHRLEQTIREYCRLSGQRRRKKWLAIGFNLAWRKDNAAGQSENLERDPDITQSIHVLIEQYNKKQGGLSSGINRYLNGETHILPRSIDRLVSLKGYVGGGPYIDHYRKTIARLARRTIYRFETAKKGSRDADHRKLQIASNIFVGCTKACKKHLLRILSDIEAGNTSACSGSGDIEIARINERIAILNSYGTESRGMGKKGTGSAGIAKIYSANKSKFKNASLDRITQSDIALDELLRITPIAGDAVRLIDGMQSPDDCNAVLAKLDVLRKHAPDGTDRFWSILIERFNAAEAKIRS